MTISKAWLVLSLILLTLPALFGGAEFWPTELSNLRNPTLIVLGITLFFLISKAFRTWLRELFLDWNNFLSPSQERLATLVVFGFFLFVFTKVTLLRYWSLNVNAEDFSFYDYAVPNTLWGRFMQTPSCHYCNHFQIHTTWILYLLLPLEILFHSPLYNLLLCPLLLWGAAIPLLFLARELNVPRQYRIMLLIAYFNLYIVSRVLMYDFHIEDFAPILLLSFAYFLLKRRWLWMTVFGILFLSVKEDMPIYFAAMCLGGIIFLRSRSACDLSLQKFLAMGIIASILVFILDTQTIRSISQMDNYRSMAPISEYGSRPVEILYGILTHPQHSIGNALKANWLPFSFIFLLTPLFFLPTLFPIIVNIIVCGCSGVERLAGLPIYVGAPLLPFELLGFLAGLQFVTSYGQAGAIEKRTGIAWKKISAFLIGVMFLQSLVVGGGYLEFHKPVQDYKSLRLLIDSVDGDKRVCAQSSLLPHFPHLKKIFLLDDQCIDPDYIILTDEAGAFPLTPVERDAVVANLINKAHYHVRALDHFKLYVREN